ncbi:MAG: hypothetical protein ACI9MB_003015, partial [Verrucomicrobiales bacterium]
MLCACFVFALVAAFWIAGDRDSNRDSSGERIDLSGIVAGKGGVALPSNHLRIEAVQADHDSTINEFDSYMEVWASSTNSPKWLQDIVIEKGTKVTKMANQRAIGFNGNMIWNPNASWVSRAVPLPTSEIGGGGPGAGGNFKPMRSIPYVCFNQGTSPEVVMEARSKVKAGYAGAREGAVFNALAFQFFDPERWLETAVHGAGLLKGDATVVTWSIVPDNTPLDPLYPEDGESAAGSNFNAFMSRIYGGRSRWLPLMRTVFDSWSENTGVHFVYEPNDDGAPSPDSDGVRGIRGDIRVSGHRIDGDSNILAYNRSPNEGDMVVDTADNYYDDTSRSSFGFRSTLGHELGHGMGLAHVCPANQTKLMEPYGNDVILLPQHDDVYAMQTQYGDGFEDPDADLFVDTNDFFETASDLGTLTNGIIHNFDPLSIHNAIDEDVLLFETQGHSATVTIKMIPLGFEYDEMEQDDACANGDPINTLEMQNLGWVLIDTSNTAIPDADGNIDYGVQAAIGDPEIITDFQLPVSTGPFRVYVFGDGGALPQLYYLEIKPEGGVLPPTLIAADSAANEADGAVPIDLQLSEPYALEATLNYVIEPIDSEIADFPQLTGSITIPANVDTFTAMIPITNDDIDEAIETFRVRFTDPYHVTLGTTEVIGTILDDDIDPGFSIQNGFISIPEGDEGTFPNVRIIINLSEAKPSATATVQVNLVPINATPGVDYEPFVGTVNIVGGATTTRITIPIIGDNEAEVDETFIVELINPSEGFAILNGTCLVTIQDDDSMALLAKSVSVSS